MADVLETLKNEYQVLEARRLNLSHELATLTSTHTLPSALESASQTDSSTDDTNLLANLFSRNQQLETKSLEKLHRIAGITLFIPNNPNEGSISQDGKQDEFLGIRFETIQNGVFELPHYVILKKDFDEEIGETYTIHRHTIPSFIPIVEIYETTMKEGVSGLEQFAQSLHRHLISLSNRSAIVARLKKVIGVEEVKTDEAVRLVEVVTAGWNGKIMLGEKAERCVVIDHENARRKDVEEIILDQSKGDLVERVSMAM